MLFAIFHLDKATASNSFSPENFDVGFQLKKQFGLKGSETGWFQDVGTHFYYDTIEHGKVGIEKKRCLTLNI